MKKKVLSIILSALVLASTATMFTGCGKETATPDEVPVMTTVDEATTEVTTEPTVSEEVKEAVKDNGLKVNDKGEVVDKKGNKVEVKDGKVEVKTDDGKTVTVKVDEVKEVTQPTQKATEPKETQKATQSTTKKPATPKPTKATKRVWVDDYKEVKTWVEPVTEKVWVDDYKEVKTWVKPVTHEEPVYEWVGYYKCNQCGTELADTNQLEQHYLANLETCWSYKTLKRQVQTGTTTVVDKEGYYKTEKVKDGGHYETKVVKKGYYKTEKVKDGGHWEYK